MNKIVDSYRFLDNLTARALKTWAAREPQRDIPWTPLNKPLSQCSVALVSTAALALKVDVPFDLDIERQNPWISDPSFRILPKDATQENVNIYHLHIQHKFAEQDLDCIFPLSRDLAELQSAGVIGSVAPRHYAYMGYTCDAGQLLKHSLPGIIRGAEHGGLAPVAFGSMAIAWSSSTIILKA